MAMLMTKGELLQQFENAYRPTEARQELNMLCLEQALPDCRDAPEIQDLVNSIPDMEAEAKIDLLLGAGMSVDEIAEWCSRYLHDDGE